MGGAEMRPSSAREIGSLGGRALRRHAAGALSSEPGGKEIVERCEAPIRIGRTILLLSRLERSIGTLGLEASNQRHSE